MFSTNLTVQFFLLVVLIQLSFLWILLSSTNREHRTLPFYLFGAGFLAQALFYGFRCVGIWLYPDLTLPYRVGHPWVQAGIIYGAISITFAWIVKALFFRILNGKTKYLPHIAVAVVLGFTILAYETTASPSFLPWATFLRHISATLFALWACLEIIDFQKKQKSHFLVYLRNVLISYVGLQLCFSLIVFVLGLQVLLELYHTHELDVVDVNLGDTIALSRLCVGIIVDALVCMFWLETYSSHAILAEESKQQLAKLLIEKEALIEHLIKTTTLIHSGALSAALAHELNQFLAVIQVNAEQANAVLATHHQPESVADNLNRIIKVNQSAAELIASLKGLFMSSDETMNSVMIDKIIFSSVELYQKRLKQANIELECKLEFGEEISVQASLIQQVFSNLLVNAIEALERSDKVDKKIIIESGSEKEHCAVTISDNGPGVDQSQSHKIFDIFETTKTNKSGIGLWLSKHIVDRHDGTISLSRNELGGATFKVVLGNLKPSN